MPLRPYQSELVEQTRQAWREGYHAPCIVLGCGGGKSVIVAEIARRTTFNGKKVLFLVHRQELVQQIIRTFIRWGVDMNYCDVMMVQTAARRCGAEAKEAARTPPEQTSATTADKKTAKACAYHYRRKSPQPCAVVQENL